jgi:CheY-like chemotaxis protein
VEIAAAQQSSTILVVDDYDPNRVLLQDLLQMEGYGVLGASDGYDALRVLKEARPDAIILDLKMPELDGRELLARLKADHDLRDIPVVLVTADRDAGKVTGVFALIKKPFEIPVLLDTVRRCTRLHG